MERNKNVQVGKTGVMKSSEPQTVKKVDINGVEYQRSRITSTTNGNTAGTYSYDGNGMRVKKVAGSTTTVYIFSSNQIIAEYDNGAVVTSPTREYIRTGEAILATIDSSGTTRYHHPDQVSVRFTTDSTQYYSGHLGQYPYGEIWYDDIAPGTKYKFTNYERDPESGNDYAVARSYVNRLGRFSSPDPIAGSVADPQTLNLFAYVRNDPINSTDPSGMFIAPLLRNLFSSFSGLSAGGFGSDWRETDFLYRQIGTAPLYHSDDPDFPFENFTSEQLQSLSGDHVIDDLGRVPVFASTLFNFAGSDNGIQPDKLTSKREVMKAFYCLWKSAGYGSQRTERSMWVTQNAQGQYGFVQWPWSATWGKETWKGPIPTGTVADAHTHPNALDPKPSTTGGNTDGGDQGTADAISLPVYVVTRDAIWKAVPGGRDPVQVAGSGWWNESKKDRAPCP
jgi:RHS repeat-associated protein